MEPLLRDPKHWRDRAATARAIAERLANSKPKQRMLGIANEYEKLAKLAKYERKRDARRIPSFLSPSRRLDSPHIGGLRKECQVDSFSGVRAFAFVLQP